MTMFRHPMSILDDFCLVIRVRRYPNRRVRPIDPWRRLRRAFTYRGIPFAVSLRSVVGFGIDL